MQSPLSVESKDGREQKGSLHSRRLCRARCACETEWKARVAGRLILEFVLRGRFAAPQDEVRAFASALVLRSAEGASRRTLQRARTASPTFSSKLRCAWLSERPSRSPRRFGRISRFAIPVDDDAACGSNDSSAPIKPLIPTPRLADEQNAANEQSPERRADAEEAHAGRRNDEGGDDGDALVWLLQARWRERRRNWS